MFVMLKKSFILCLFTQGPIMIHMNVYLLRDAKNMAIYGNIFLQKQFITL